MDKQALTVVENQLTSLSPKFAEVLPDTVDAKRLIRTIVVACSRMPKLLECNRQSLMQSAMSAAVLGLEVDGVTGQAFLIPFKDRAQLIIGYKGFNTLAARSGYTITGSVVRESDEFAFDKGEGWLRHTWPLAERGEIQGAWAKAEHRELPSVIEVLSIQELNAVRSKSPGSKKKDSPWNDHHGPGFAAMCEKTAKRRLARSMPLNLMQFAARIDEATEEQGKAAYYSPDSGTVVVEGDDAIDVSENGPQQAPQPATEAIVGPKPDDNGESESAKRARLYGTTLRNAKDDATRRKIWNQIMPHLPALDDAAEQELAQINDAKAREFS